MAAVGSMTPTYEDVHSPKQTMRKVTLAWTSDASGNVSGILTAYLVGFIMRVVFIPSASAAPTANYDVMLLDLNGIDVLSNQGQNLSATVTSEVAPGVSFKDGTTTATTQRAIDDTLELQVANAGNAKKGSVILYIL